MLVIRKTNYKRGGDMVSGLTKVADKLHIPLKNWHLPKHNFTGQISAQAIMKSYSCASKSWKLLRALTTTLYWKLYKEPRVMTDRCKNVKDWTISD